jgi:hypothetical protein
VGSPRPDIYWAIKGQHAVTGKIVEIYQLSVEEGIAPKMMTENCRTFFKEVAVPVSNCLCNHFCNDKFAFL